MEITDNLISYVYKKTNGKYIIIGSGGVFSAEDAYDKIKRGASLIQLITGMIYEGPQLIGEINAGLVKLLKADGYKNISEAIGVNSK
jgi:dihydroorotate dehydrogenase